MIKSSAFALFMLGTADAFSGSRFSINPTSNMRRSDFSLGSVGPLEKIQDQIGIEKKPLTAADILSRARKSVGMSTEKRLF